jgi:molecular chaperone GrpE
MVKKKIHEEEHKKSVHKEEVTVDQQTKDNTITVPDDAIKADEEMEKNAVEEDLTAKLTEMQDKYLRLSAEFDNYRKRTLKEKMEMAKTASESVMVGLLPVIDDFERALLSIGETNDCNSIRAGIDLIYNKFSDFLKQNGVREIVSFNHNFDADIHEAITKIAAPDDSLKGKVVDVIQKGYTLNEKVIRFPKVVVGE